MQMQHSEKSFSLKTMEDGQVLLYSVRFLSHYIIVLPQACFFLYGLASHSFFFPLELSQCSGSKNFISMAGF